MKTLAALALTIAAASAFAEPAIFTITPASGLTAGGDYVHIHGTDLLPPPVPCTPPCALVVKFGGLDANVVSDTSDEIVVRTPAHAAGSVDVQIAQATKATITLANGFRYDDVNPSDNIRFLAPIVISASGANGSSWVSELSVTNASSEPLTIAATNIGAQNSASIALPNANTGAFFTIPRAVAHEVTATLRVHDTTRDADSWGTDIPVVPETQFRPTVVLPHVPNDPRFRTLLRVYGYNTFFANGVAVIRDDLTGQVLSTQPFTLRSDSANVPAYAQLPIAVTTPSRVRIDVRAQLPGAPLQPPVAIWAFVAITNNTTQQVTTITPSLIPSTAPAVTTPLELGHWAGGGSCVDVTNIDTMVTMGCGTATFPSPGNVSSGHFEADGTFSTYAGPAPPSGVPAHFTGVVLGTQMDLTIAVSGGSTFTIHVTFGSTEPCPVLCR
ncbi:MAG TPA: IPT/TIG domain-containing protein [Thermoanaerobaculia bacterium]|nr:IPT/TIG domain-containing protein [Thermoanaerobaculia bacterium]